MSSAEESDFRIVSDWYSDGYEETFHTGLIGRVYKSVYRFMERPHRRGGVSSIMEVGAGSGNYRTETNPNFSRYVELDLREIPQRKKIPFVERTAGNAQDLSRFSDGEFERLIATCVLVHLDNPLQALREWRRVVRRGGSLTIYVPPEAGLLVRWVRKLVTWRAPSAAGLDARRIASLQHKFSYFYLEAIIQEVFEGDSVRRRTFPFQLFEFDLALFHVFEITRGAEEEPKKGRGGLSW